MSGAGTDRDRLEAALRESEAARAVAERGRAEAEAALRFNEVVSGILAHDLKNPLAAVLMNARLLRGSTGERERTISTRIITSSERMSRMIDQILDWTHVRGEAARIAITRTDCDLGVIANEVVAEVRASNADVPIAIEARGALGGRWDADRLAQVLSNLVGNAVVHASRPGVSVLLDGAGKDVRLVVENEGEIEDALLPVIFEPFRGRASGTPSRARGHGLGLGLYIARQIALAHGGSVDVARVSDARVAFTVTLPRDPSA